MHNLGIFLSLLVFFFFLSRTRRVSAPLTCEQSLTHLSGTLHSRTLRGNHSAMLPRSLSGSSAIPLLLPSISLPPLLTPLLVISFPSFIQLSYLSHLILSCFFYLPLHMFTSIALLAVMVTSMTVNVHIQKAVFKVDHVKRSIIVSRSTQSKLHRSTPLSSLPSNQRQLTYLIPIQSSKPYQPKPARSRPHHATTRRHTRAHGLPCTSCSLEVEDSGMVVGLSIA